MQLANFLRQEELEKNKYLFLFAAAAFIAGIFFRFWDLGGAPLAVDEYFLGTSTLNTEKYGLPKFACGGYYTRGILLQYLTLPLLALGASLEFAVRFWPAIASILSIIAVWRIALLAGGTQVALIAIVLMSLSVWEIEFARFGRMYAPFQAAFLWYTYFQIQHLVNGHNAARWFYLIISAVAVLIYEGAAMLIVLNFLALIWPGKRWSIAHLVVAFGLLVATVKFFTINFRRLGAMADQNLPAETQNNASSSADLVANIPIDFPNLPETALPLVVIGACILAFAIWRHRGQILLTHPASIYWFVALLCFCSGFLAFGIALVLAGRLMTLPSPIRSVELRPQSIRAWLATLFALWLVVLVASFQFSGADILSSFKESLRYILNFPDVYYKIVSPWMEAIPFTTLFLTILAAVALRQTLRLVQDQSSRRSGSAGGYLFAAVILLAILVGLLPQPYMTTRYTYFLYPLLIILASAGFAALSGAFLTQQRMTFFAVIALVASLFVLTEDFELNHLANINKPDIRYRKNYSKALEVHYYRRWDFRSVAFHVNANMSPKDKVIVFDQPLPHYLNRTTGIYVRQGSQNYKLIQSCGGQRDLWSNVLLLSQEKDVQQVIDTTEGRVWLIVRTDKYAFRDPLEWLLVERFDLNPDFISQDGYLAAYVIDAS